MAARGHVRKRAAGLVIRGAIPFSQHHMTSWRTKCVGHQFHVTCAPSGSAIRRTKPAVRIQGTNYRTPGKNSVCWVTVKQHYTSTRVQPENDSFQEIGTIVHGGLQTRGLNQLLGTKKELTEPKMMENRSFLISKMWSTYQKTRPTFEDNASASQSYQDGLEVPLVQGWKVRGPKGMVTFTGPGHQQQDPMLQMGGPI